jgi:hypothetical protein
MKIEKEADATGNQRSGFCVEGRYTRLETGEGCIASTNSSHGFAALRGGQLLVGYKNESKDNAGCGFLSSGQDSLVKLSKSCRAEYNKGHGYRATAQGKLFGRGDCWASDNMEERRADNVFMGVLLSFPVIVTGVVVAAIRGSSH